MGWIYESANVLATRLQATVAAMTNKARQEGGGVHTNFSRFSMTELKKVRTALEESKSKFLLKQALNKNRKDTFGSNYMDYDSWVSCPDSEVEIWVIICVDCSSPLVV